MRNFHRFSLVALGLVAACATIQIEGDPAVEVGAVAQTEPVGTADEDAADDPAIWRNAADPSASLIVATDKKAGLYVYGLDGSVRSFLGGGLLNNVDLIELADGTILVGASDRGDPANAKILLASLDTRSGTLSELARVDAGPGEAYGFCIGEQANDGSVTLFSPIKDGRIARNTVRRDGDGWSNATETFSSVPSQPEGCVYDSRTNRLYVGEEMAGIWRFDVASGVGDLVAAVDNRMIVADVEGLALAPDGEDGGYLVASSQGDNAYAVFSLPDMRAVGRFRIGGNAIGATEETDGIALHLGSFGASYPGGLFVAQDGINPPAAQNFKLASWEAILSALEAR
ncbi:3-phytase [Altererythrobacter xiamenensis]|uniref:3-phytase n=1 Tax=Altererythrobacter xiamenensis TaxID=1316679 RepID=A0A1Y6F894_9SPHN|nr:phytase [Altererythrobacter xiamenensis]SMQ69821.1 3-phytase [Altererythrobacter xiamenensis]